MLIELEASLLGSREHGLSFTACERLSREPAYELELCSPQADLDLDGLLGDPLGIRIDLGEGEVRHFHGYVFGGQDTGQLDDQYTYRLEIRSWLSFLEQNSNCRIFQDLTVPQIVEQVFAGHQRADYRLQLQEQYAPREYCVQYRESDLNFVKRLLEDEGLYFWVEHEAQRHVVVISDNQRFEDQEGRYATLSFLPDGEENRAIAGLEGVQRLQRTRQVRSNNVVLRDYDYLAPGKSLQVDAQEQQETLAGVQLEHYDYGAGYADAQRGEWLARLRLEALQAQAQLVQGKANAMGICVGRAFTLQGHPDARRNRRFYVVSSELSWVQDGPQSSAQGNNFTCSYESLADDRPYRPLRRTPKPRVPGTHSATVVGPEGSEVHTDELARIRVHFHWDRYKSTEEDASCWMRTASAWHGKGWGFVAMPRVGQEVLIGYIDGDLDRPLAIGTVYNGENPVPYDLPKDIRYSGMVSRSLKQGEVQNASLITVDDQRGAERLMLHAERDLQQTVERNKSTSVGHYMNLHVERILTIAVGSSSLGGELSGDSSAGSESTSSGEIKNSITGVSNSQTGESSSITGVSTSVTSKGYSLTGLAISRTGVSISFTGLSFSCTDVSTSFTGCSTSLTGSSTSFTGMASSFTGVSTSFGGVRTSFTAVGTSMTGLSTSLTGVSVSLTGASVSVTGTRASMTGFSASMTGISESKTGMASSLTGIAFSATGHSTAAIGVENKAFGTIQSKTGVSISETDVSNTFTGSSTSSTGSSNSTTGSSTSSVGSSDSSTGASESSTKCQRSTVGSAVSTTGCDRSTTDSKITRIGNSVSNTGVQYSFVGQKIECT